MSPSSGGEGKGTKTVVEQSETTKPGLRNYSPFTLKRAPDPVAENKRFL
jgi:hypothetical protein